MPTGRMIARRYYTRAGQLVRVYQARAYPRSGRRARLRWQRHGPAVLDRMWQRVRGRLGFFKL